MRRKIQFVLEIEQKLENCISCFLILGLVLLSFTNVIMRYFFNAPIQWAEEMLVAGFVWLTFWSIGLCYRDGGFIHIDLIDSVISLKAKNFLSYIIDCIIGIFSFFVLYWSLKLSVQAHVKLTNIIRIPYSYIDISIFLGFLSLNKEILVKYLIAKR